MVIAPAPPGTRSLETGNQVCFFLISFPSKQMNFPPSPCMVKNMRRPIVATLLIQTGIVFRPSVNITKTEVRGPKTSPYAVYIMHIRTAFSVTPRSRVCYAMLTAPTFSIRKTGKERLIKMTDAWSDQVRGLARRFSEFKELDLQLRGLFSSLPPLPGRRVFGSLSAPLVAEV